ncbi:biotin carboxylase 1, chloroplastic-like [Daucus carota subsp. sativus]|uniref:biotin carboxylase 1, chloroplastic-like n=1 Tax=Daucus carota subsp. sativus TaxID=79200 RepID=UPI003082FE43
MKNAGFTIVPGSDGLLQATAGGGGRGMRLAKERDKFRKLLQAVESEASAAFGNDGVYLEKYIHNPMHIEVQNTLHILYLGT